MTDNPKDAERLAKLRAKTHPILRPGWDDELTSRDATIADLERRLAGAISNVAHWRGYAHNLESDNTKLRRAAPPPPVAEASGEPRVLNPCMRPAQCTDAGFGPENCELCNPTASQPTADHTERALEALAAAKRAGAEKRALDEAVIEAARNLVVPATYRIRLAGGKATRRPLHPRRRADRGGIYWGAGFWGWVGIRYPANSADPEATSAPIETATSGGTVRPARPISQQITIDKGVEPPAAPAAAETFGDIGLVGFICLSRVQLEPFRSTWNREPRCRAISCGPSGTAPRHRL